MNGERTLLVIDADPETHAKLEEVFEGDEVRIVRIETAADAVVAVMTELPDAAVVSLEMPDGDGVAMLKNMRIMNNEVPIIALVAVPTKEKVLEAKNARVLDLLKKPADWNRIHERLTEVFNPPEPKVEFEPTEPEPAPEPFVEAVPKGAEVMNINDVIAGMKVARTLVHNGVVFADKGQLLTDVQIKQLNRMGVAEICVYINPELKRLAAERKKRLLQQKSIKVEMKTVQKGEKVFTTVKREAVRIPTDIMGKLTYTDKDNNQVEMDTNIVDISAGGCAILTHDKINKDQHIFLTFKLEKD